MAFTSTDLDALDRAIATGELSVRSASGHMVTYRDMDDLLKARSLVANDLAQQAATTAGTQRAYPRHQLASFND